MSRCDCCGCVLEDDYGTSTVAGTGTFDDPFTVTRVDPAFVRPAVKVTRSILANVPNNTPTEVPFTTEVFDTNAMWIVGTPTRITFQTRGIFQFGAYWTWPANTTGRREGLWRYTPANGSGAVTLINESVATSGNVFRRQLNYQWFFEIGDYVELLVTQSSGGLLNLDAADAWAVYMGRKV